MKRKFVSVVVCLAFLAVFLVPATALAAAPPKWKVGDQWSYNVSYNSGPPFNLVNAGVLNTNVTSIADKVSYQMGLTFVPPALRIENSLLTPMQVTAANLLTSKKHAQYMGINSNILINVNPAPPPYVWAPAVANITYTYDSKLKPKYGAKVGSIWRFVRDGVVTGLGPPIISQSFREAKFVDVQDITVPAGTFRCNHIVEYDPLTPLVLTYEHWYSPDIGSDVKMIDNETFFGSETRDLASTNYGPMVTSIAPNSGNALVNATITGTNFIVSLKKKTKVVLIQAGVAKPKKVTAKNIVVVDANTITCDLYMEKALPATTWDVVVTSPNNAAEYPNPNKRTGRLLGGFSRP